MMIFSRGRSVRSTLILGVVALCTVLGAHYAYAQYPDGERSSEAWYYCYAYQLNNVEGSFTGVAWTDEMVCERILWSVSSGGGGVVESVDLLGSVTATGIDNVGQAAKLRGFVVPPQGMRDFDYACTAGAEICHEGGSGSASASARSAVGSLFSEVSTGWVLNATSPTAEGACNTSVIDVVGKFRSSVDDTWWDNDTPLNWTTSGSTVGTYWEISALTISDARSSGASFRCNITDWESQPAWLVTNPEWEVGDGDLYESPSADLVGMIPITWEEWNSIETTLTFDLGSPEEIGCYDIVPGFSETVETWVGDYPVGFEGVELCVRERSLNLQIDEFNIGGWAVALFSFMGIGALWMLLLR